jgi:hypothetical protein
LETKGLVSVWHFNGRTIEFKGLNYFSGERGEVGSDGFITISVEYEDAGTSVYRIIELDKIIEEVGGEGDCSRRVDAVA